MDKKNSINISSASSLFCCNPEMIKIMRTSMLLAANVFGRCETCVKNLFHYICALTCSPKASRFMTPKVIEKAPNGSKLNNFRCTIETITYRYCLLCTEEYIKEIDYYITEKYVEGVYESCNGVILPASGSYAMDMACGKYDSHTCNGKKMVRPILIFSDEYLIGFNIELKNIISYHSM